MHLDAAPIAAAEKRLMPVFIEEEQQKEAALLAKQRKLEQEMAA